MIHKTEDQALQIGSECQHGFWWSIFGGDVSGVKDY